MSVRLTTAFLGVLALGACETIQRDAVLSTVPESVTAIAAPNQDLSTVRLRTEDNCFWYSHRGPVETTELPLRDVSGRPICVKPATI